AVMAPTQNSQPEAHPTALGSVKASADSGHNLELRPGTGAEAHLNTVAEILTASPNQLPLPSFGGSASGEVFGDLIRAPLNTVTRTAARTQKQLESDVAISTVNIGSQSSEEIPLYADFIELEPLRQKWNDEHVATAIARLCESACCAPDRKEAATTLTI